MGGHKCKNIKVEEFHEEVNRLLALDNDAITQEFKKGICGIWEHFSMKTGNYGGFQHIYWMKQGFTEWKDAGEPGFPEKQKYFGKEYDRRYF